MLDDGGRHDQLEGSRDRRGPRLLAARAPEPARQGPARRTPRRDGLCWQDGRPAEGCFHETDDVGGVRCERSSRTGRSRAGPCSISRRRLHDRQPPQPPARWWPAWPKPARAVAIVADHRLGPEHRFPAAVEDATAVYRALLDGGTEPGSCRGRRFRRRRLDLGARLVAQGRGLPQPAGVFVISPWADLTQSGASYAPRRATDPMISKPGLDQMRWPISAASIPRPARLAGVRRLRGRRAGADPDRVGRGPAQRYRHHGRRPGPCPGRRPPGGLAGNDPRLSCLERRAPGRPPRDQAWRAIWMDERLGGSEPARHGDGQLVRPFPAAILLLGRAVPLDGGPSHAPRSTPGPILSVIRRAARKLAAEADGGKLSVADCTYLGALTGFRARLGAIRSAPRRLHVRPGRREGLAGRRVLVERPGPRRGPRLPAGPRTTLLGRGRTLRGADRLPDPDRRGCVAIRHITAFRDSRSLQRSRWREPA